MTRKRKTEQRKARKLEELNTIQKKDRKDLKEKKGGSIALGSASNAFMSESHKNKEL